MKKKNYAIDWVKYFAKKLIYAVKTKRVFDTAFFDETNEKTLFITHNFKGGTVQYENNFVAEHKDNVIVLKVVTHGKTLAYLLEDKKNKHKIFVNKRFFPQILSYNFKEIVVSSLVSANNFAEILSALVSYKKAYKQIPLVYLVHDFHCICPKYNLVCNDEFCNLQCKKNDCKFHIFPECTTVSICYWRKVWSNFLFEVDRIICFSESSKELILRSYSLLDSSKIIVKPHDMSWVKFTPIPPVYNSFLRIAVVGAVVSVPKGKLVVERLLECLSENIHVSLIGLTKDDIHTSRKNTEFLGRYSHDELQNIIESCRINLVVFPSICPETFSYLISELIMMDVPIICFDFGAQAEKVGAYYKGKVVKNEKEMISYIESLHKEIPGECNKNFS